MIRAALPEDAAAIAALDPTWTAEQLAGTLDLPTTLAYLVYDDAGALIGHVIANAVADIGEIVLIAVDPAVRRQGIARRLMRLIADEWRARGVVEAWLEVRIANGAAIGLYQSEDWREVDIRKGYYRDGTDALVMAWTAGR
jgi:ribosomal-protein-alanine N-acetyltransferase